MKKTNGWVNALFALVFIATPAIIAFYFWLPGWAGHEQKLWFYWVVALGYLVYMTGLSFLFIKLEILSIDSLNFNIPMSLVFVTIFVSFDWHIAIRIIAVIFCILFAFPVNIYTNRYMDHKLFRRNKQTKSKKKR